MKIEIEEKQGIATITPHVESLTVSNAADCRKAMEEFFSKERLFEEEKKILLDLTHIKSIDSTGLSTLLAVALSLQKRPDSFAIVSTSPEIAEAFSITHFDRFFPIVNNRDDAKRLLSKEKKPANNLSHKSPKEAMEEKLLQQYRLTIPEKLDALKNGLRHLQENPCKEAAQALRSLFHNIAGSAGSYGFIDAGKTAKEADAMLGAAIDANGFASTLFQKLALYIETLTIQFDPTFHKGDEERSRALLPVKKNSCLLVSEDKELASRFVMAAKSLAHEFTLIDDPKTLFIKMEKNKSPPALIVVEEDYLQYNVTGFEIIQKLKQTYSTSKIDFILIVKEENIALNLKAIDLGISCILKKPVTEKMAQEALEKYGRGASPREYRVLIVDDDPDICRFMQRSLEEINLPVKILEDETKILETLFDFQPHLLLLDIYMPKYDGWAILRGIRKDLRYKNLLIVIITATDKDLYQMAMADGANDVITKPFTQEKLQKKVLSLLEKQPAQSLETQTNSLLSRKEFFSLLESIAFAKPSASANFPLVLIGIEEFDKARTLGKGVENELMASAVTLLEADFSDAILKGDLGDGVIGLLFSGQSNESIKKRTSDFTAKDRYKLRTPSQGDFFPSIAGTVIVNYPEERDSHPFLEREIALFKKSLQPHSHTLMEV